MTTYAGATARIDIRAARALPSRRFVFQPKLDGAYCMAVTDARGRIARLLSRTGHAFGRSDIADLIGVSTGHRDAVLIGEIEAHTEVGVRAREARGFPLIHVFDAVRLGGRMIASAPYADRLAALIADRSHAEVSLEDPWSPAHGGRYRDRASGQYDRKVPRDHRRLPIVECSRDVAELWQRHVMLGGGEGLVAVRVDAPMGARGAKRKIKPTDEFTGTVIDRGPKAARIDYRGIRFVVSATGARSAPLAPGVLVDFACDGWALAGQPRNPRIVRARLDLTPPSVLGTKNRPTQEGTETNR